MGKIIQSGDINSAQKIAKLGIIPGKARDLNVPEVPMVRMTRGAADPIHTDYNTIDEMESESQKIAKIEMWMAKHLGSALVRTYPGRQWGVQINLEGGLLVVLCPSLSNEKGYHILLKGDTIHALELKTLRAGGEILERYNVSRNRDVEEADIEEGLVRDHKDEVISADAHTTKTL